MKKVIKKAAVFGFLFSGAISFTSFGQTFEEDIERIIQNVESSNYVAIDANCKVFDTRGGNVIYSTQASIRSDSSSRWVKLDDQEFLNTSNYFVSIDHEEKKVLMLDRQKMNTPDLSNLNVKKLLKSLKLNSSESEESNQSSELLSETGSVRKYRLVGVEGYDAITFTLDINDKSVLSIEYAGENFIQINYTKFSFNQHEFEQLKISRIVTISQGQFELTKAYNNYKLFTEL